MEFYDRTNELTELQRIQNLSFSDHSRLTVVTGRPADAYGKDIQVICATFDHEIG